MVKLDEDFLYEVYSIVEEIPEGFVVTYKQIAILMDRPLNARLVGKALSFAGMYGDYPCHRVVNSSGMTAAHFINQRYLLEQEGVEFKENGNVDLKKYKWNTEND